MLPDAASEFLAHRFYESLSLVLFVTAAVLTASIVSYNPNDPSLNVITNKEAYNFLGGIGAIIADITFQMGGIAICIPILVFLVWGGRLWKHILIKRFFLRVLGMIAATMITTYGLAAIPSPSGWYFTYGLGGSVGDILFNWEINYLTDIGFTDYHILAFLGLIFCGFVFFLFSLGISQQEWVFALRVALSLIGKLFVKSRNLLNKDHILFNRFKSWVLGKKAQQKNHRSPAHPTTKNSSGPGTIDVLVSPKKRAKNGKKAIERKQGNLPLEPTEKFEPPLLEFLKLQKGTISETQESQNALKQNALYLATILEEYGVRGKIVKVRPGPVVTLYELEPAPGTKTSRVISLADDIARSMSAISVRVAVVAGKNAIGIEIPNQHRETVYLRELLSSEDFEKTKAALPLALGKDIGGGPITVDLARMPHLLIAGTTGSGKSVAMNTMILSLLYNLSPKDCKFIMIDPKMLELSVYEDIPNLITPVVTDPSKAVVALKWVVREMEDRYRSMSQLGVRNIAGYNSKLLEASKTGKTLSRIIQTGFDELGQPIFEEQAVSEDPLPFIVVVVDEMADLMLVAGKDVEAAIQRLAQMARAAGIHLMMATQRPSVDVITGTIKANFPSRISFQVTSKIDSRTILGEQGAEQLLGQGDMLYMAGGGRISRIHGPFVSDSEVEEVVSFLKTQGKPAYIDDITAEELNSNPNNNNPLKENTDALYDEAVMVVTREGKASTSFIQRHLQIGYNRAARIIDQMEAAGIISAANRVGRREILGGLN